MQSFLIASPGRTGSSFLTDYIKNLSKALGINDVSVTQTHDATTQMSQDTVAIQCRRRDLWAHTLSSVISQKRNEWIEYTDCNEDFVIDLDDFENKYVWNLRWFDAFEHYTRYDKRIDLFFEDFMQDHMVINRSLGFPEVAASTDTHPSPNLKNKIKNLQELKSFFDRLESNDHLHTFPITQRCWEFKLPGE